MKQSKQWLLAGIAALMTFVFTGCGGGAASPAVASAMASNQVLYTQTGMWYEQNHRGVNIASGTNYKGGVYIPVNTKVTVLDTTRYGALISVNGINVELHNVTKYTALDNGAFIDRMLGTAPVSLSKFTDAERAAIKKGALVKGMSKAAVIVSRGYPPSHATPSLDGDRWRYWKNRWATMYVDFSNGKVSGFVE